LSTPRLTQINYTWPWRIWTFILMSGGIFALRGFIAAAIPDTPPWVEIQVGGGCHMVCSVV
jgi:hypothetical protein